MRRFFWNRRGKLGPWQRRVVSRCGKPGVALVLMWAAGFVDKLGFLTLSHILAAAISVSAIK